MVGIRIILLNNGGGELDLISLDNSRKYDFSKESNAHKTTKEAVYNQLKNHDNLDDLYFDIEQSLYSDVTADIGGYHDGKLLAVEIVHSHENYTDYRKKVNSYHKEKIHDFWIYTEERIHEYMEYNLKPCAMMHDLQKRFGRIYYYDVEEDVLRIVVFYLEDGEYKWVVLPFPWEISFNNLALSELKYLKYVCKEEQHELDYNVDETREFLRYEKEMLKKQCEESQLPNAPQKVVNKEFQFVVGEPVRLRFIECVPHPNFEGDEVIIIDIDGKKWWVRKHTGLMFLFKKYGHAFLEVTLNGKPNGEIKWYQYSGRNINEM